MAFTQWGYNLMFNQALKNPQSLGVLIEKSRQPKEKEQFAKAISANMAGFMEAADEGQLHTAISNLSAPRFFCIGDYRSGVAEHNPFLMAVDKGNLPAAKTLLQFMPEGARKSCHSFLLTRMETPGVMREMAPSIKFDSLEAADAVSREKAFFKMETADVVDLANAVGKKEDFAFYLARQPLPDNWALSEDKQKLADNYRTAFAACGTENKSPQDMWNMAVESENFELARVLKPKGMNASKLSQASAAALFTKVSTAKILEEFPDFFSAAPMGHTDALVMDSARVGRGPGVDALIRHVTAAPEQLEATLSRLQSLDFKDGRLRFKLDAAGMFPKRQEALPLPASREFAGGAGKPSLAV